jgi:hypothetical protein
VHGAGPLPAPVGACGEQGRTEQERRCGEGGTDRLPTPKRPRDRADPRHPHPHAPHELRGGDGLRVEPVVAVAGEAEPVRVLGDDAVEHDAAVEQGAAVGRHVPDAVGRGRREDDEVALGQGRFHRDAVRREEADAARGQQEADRQDGGRRPDGG